MEYTYKEQKEDFFKATKPIMEKFARESIMEFAKWADNHHAAGGIISFDFQKTARLYSLSKLTPGKIDASKITVVDINNLPKGNSND